MTPDSMRMQARPLAATSQPTAPPAQVRQQPSQRIHYLDWLRVLALVGVFLYHAVRPFADAAAHGELVVNATAGATSVDALRLAGEANLDGKILVDIANALDFSRGMPPSLLVANTDSLGERIQRAFPDVKVVKALNTMTAPIMVNPGQLAGGGHAVFVCGDDPEAKALVTGILREFGWRDVLDLGDLTAARATEMVLPIWLRLMGALQTPMFNFKVVR